MKLLNFGLRILMWLGVFARGSVTATWLAAKRSDDSDLMDFVAAAMIVPASVANSMDVVGGAAGIALAVTEEKVDDRVMAGGLGAALLVSFARTIQVNYLRGR